MWSEVGFCHIWAGRGVKAGASKALCVCVVGGGGGDAVCSLFLSFLVQSYSRYFLLPHSGHLCMCNAVSTGMQLGW